MRWQILMIVLGLVLLGCGGDGSSDHAAVVGTWTWVPGETDPEVLSALPVDVSAMMKLPQVLTVHADGSAEFQFGKDAARHGMWSRTGDTLHVDWNARPERYKRWHLIGAIPGAKVYELRQGMLIPVPAGGWPPGVPLTDGPEGGIKTQGHFTRVVTD